MSKLITNAVTKSILNCQNRSARRTAQIKRLSKMFIIHTSTNFLIGLAQTQSGIFEFNLNTPLP